MNEHTQVAVDSDGRLRPLLYLRHRKHCQEEGRASFMAETLDVERVVPCPDECPEPHPYHYRNVVIGEVMVEVCTTCLYTTTTCMHTKNTWHDSGQILLCDVCGIDGT